MLLCLAILFYFVIDFTINTDHKSSCKQYENKKKALIFAAPKIPFTDTFCIPEKVI